MNGFIANADRIQEFKEKQLGILADEKRLADGFKNWFDSLEEFRNHIKQKYIRMNFFDRVYKPRFVTMPTGDLIDHHSLSYLAPLDFTRIGWNGERLAPYEHMKKISNFFTDREKRFIYVALPNKGAVYPELMFNSEDLEDIESKAFSAKWGGYYAIHHSGANILVRC